MNRQCSRPGCSTPAVATLTFDYRARLARLERLETTPHPMAYDLCQMHADRQTVPVGWSLADDRVVHHASFPPAEDTLAS